MIISAFFWNQRLRLASSCGGPRISIFRRWSVPSIRRKQTVCPNSTTCMKVCFSESVVFPIVFFSNFVLLLDPTDLWRNEKIRRLGGSSVHGRGISTDSSASWSSGAKCRNLTALTQRAMVRHHNYCAKRSLLSGHPKQNSKIVSAFRFR